MVKFFGLELFPSTPAATAPAAPDVTVDDLDPFAYSGQTSFAGADFSIYDGGKFAGGFGDTQIFNVDYWTLRARSVQLFTENLYARGLIRRLITNEINTGITLEACPDEEIIGLAPDTLAGWTETVENRFHVWSKEPRLCDWRQERTFGALQRAARLEALISGDVLVVLRQSSRTKTPTVQLVGGDKVQTPLGGKADIKSGHTVRHGVELNPSGVVVAYWVRQDDGTFKRLARHGSRSGRRVAWLVFGTDKRLDDLRGQPLLAIVLQSLKEIDRYRDASVRKAVVNSIVTMFMKKTADKPGTLPLQGGARRRDAGTVTDSDGKTRTYTTAHQVPGLTMEELQVGEEPVAFRDQGTGAEFGVFEGAIIQAIAWASEVPPEILQLAFSNNYSASQAAINEFKIYLNKFWSEWGESFCTPIFVDWLLSEVLSRRVDAPGLLSAWRSPLKWDVFGAWTLTEWYGSIKPSTDILKQAKGSQLLVKEGWSTNARESRANTGTKFSKNIKRLERENVAKAAAARPILELESEFGQDALNVVDNYLETMGASDASD